MTGRAGPTSDAGHSSSETQSLVALRSDGADQTSCSPPLLQPEERVLSTLNRDGSRRWLRPRVSPGRFLSQRRWVAYALIALFAAVPFVQINGRPAVLFDLAQREFTILGFTFLPADTILLALFLLALIVGVFLLTALLGRIWCGWACPQTVYLEFVYRPLERLFEGTRGRGGRPSTSAPAWRRVVQFAVFLVVSACVANIFLAYFVGVEALSRWVRQSPLEHPMPFLVMAATTLLMFFDFAYFREQTCIVACPYGRLQSVLLDRQSLVISYDAKRGEPRGKLRRTNSELPVSEPSRGVQGDCIDCKLCVVTCPTGIDIRGGLQMECIGCAQCIDACDAVMKRIRRPLGLIRYSSQAAIEGERKGLLRPRVLLYPALLLVIVAALVAMLVTKPAADVMLFRGFGRPFVELPDGTISNAVRVKVTNRTAERASYSFSIVGDAEVRVQCDENPVDVEAGESHEVGLLLIAPKSAFVRGARSVILRAADARGFSRELNYRLMGPESGQATKEAPKP